MSTIITRLFDSAEKAAQAVRELGRNRIHPEFVSVFKPGTNTTGDVLAKAMQEAEVPAKTAKAAAEAVDNGATAVTVNAAFGFAAVAQAVLARFDGKALEAEDHYQQTLDPSARFSSMLGLKVLCNDPAPLSRWLALRVLSAKQTGNATLKNDPAPLSRTFGMKMLSDSPAPLSGTFGAKLLIDDPAPLSSKIGMEVLSKNQGSKTELMKDPAPLSNLLGIKLLSKNPTPLSSFLGWSVLTSRQ